ncbi:MAG: hypothetical protein HY365_02515 [Candidatus Aenigmarchaeota archaeon]|nr:hypothetical protein [Candidatus Aenigmarchaeota archaeon]
MISFVNEWKEDGNFRKAIFLFIAVKIILLLVAASSQLIPAEFTQRQERDGNVFINPWAQYDAAAYVDIAMNGYNAAFAEGRGNYGWFPLYPLMIRALGFMGYYFAGFLISNALSLLAVAVMYLVIKKDFTGDVALKAVALMSLFPTSYFFNAVYTESLFLLETAAFFWFSRKGNHFYAGVAGFMAALTRMQGSLLFLPSLYVNAKKGGNVLYSLLIPLGFAAMLAYQYAVTGDAFAQFSTHVGFAREVSLPFMSIYNGVAALISNAQIGDVPGTFYNGFNLFILAFFGWLLVKSYGKIPNEQFIFFAASLLLPLLSSRLEAISRFYLVIFPAFAVMALQQKGEGTAIKIMYAVFIVLMLLFTIRHGNEELPLFG